MGVTSLRLNIFIRCYVDMVSVLGHKSYNWIIFPITSLYFITTLCFCLLRPEGPMYRMFRSQFLAFSIYQSEYNLLAAQCGLCLLFVVILFNVSLAGCVQFLQYYYQSGCLYRLRALGERNQLDLTVGKHWDRFESWEKCWPGWCHQFTLQMLHVWPEVRA